MHHGTPNEIAEAYRHLDLEPGATLEDVNSQYRFFVQAFHPDKYSESQRNRAEEKMKRVNAARDVLLRHLKAHPAGTPRSAASVSHDSSVRTTPSTPDPERQQRAGQAEQRRSEEARRAADAEKRRAEMDARQAAEIRRIRRERDIQTQIAAMEAELAAEARRSREAADAGIVPRAAWCAKCRDYVWVTEDGGCSNGHGRPNLRGMYDPTPPLGPLPLFPPLPDGTPGKLHPAPRLPNPLRRITMPVSNAAAECRSLGHDWGPPMPGESRNRQCRRCGRWTGWR